MEKTTKKTAIDSQIKVNLPEKTKTSVFVERNISSEAIGKDMASRITGKMIDVEELYDPKTKCLITQKKLQAKGAVFLTVDFQKVLTFETKDTVKKGRTTKNPIPYILKKFKTQIIANIDWAKYINRRNEEADYKADDKRKNGVKNFEGCKAIGETKKGFKTINGILFKTLENTKYFDENGNEYTDIIGLKNEYFKKTYDQEQESKQKEADKHGIKLKLDPQYRTVRIDNCKTVRAFGFEYKPTDNILNEYS